MKLKIAIILLICLFLFKSEIKKSNSFSSLKNKSLYQLTNSKIHQYIESTLHSLDEYRKDANIKEIGQLLSSRLAILYSINTISKDPILIRNSKYGFWKIIRKAKFSNLSKYFKTKGGESIKQFTYKKGHLPEKITKEKFFTILSFNVCFTPDDMPLFFGGILPWKERIDNTIAFIEKADADIICLQEVFDHNAQDKLYNSLSKKYAHFYINIGPWQFDGSLSSLGFNGGLFVASKYPLKNPNFQPFKKDNQHINRGVFSFEIMNSNKEIIGSIFTTHLEPFESGKTLREKELTQIVSYMQLKDNEKPIILCGDLNLPVNEAKKWINTYFEDSVNINELKVTQDNLTSCDFTNHRLMIDDSELRAEYLDYTLLLKKVKPSKINTSIIKSFNPKHLDNAISDHHALLSKIVY